MNDETILYTQEDHIVWASKSAVYSTPRRAAGRDK